MKTHTHTTTPKRVISNVKRMKLRNKNLAQLTHIVIMRVKYNNKTTTKLYIIHIT
jgi:hypothetical protein